MASWEFLLQKEGDRSWLPLESSKVEVLEGRYRIVAHARQPNMPIEIRITHNAITEIPPIRRTQKRFSRTNQNGLVVVMPFTRLLPGAWDLRCTSDLMAEMLGEGWQYSLRLQVLPLEVEPNDEWEPDWQAGHTEEAASATPSPQAEPVAIENHSTLDATNDVTSLPHIASSGSASDLLPLSTHSLTTSPSDPPSTPHAASSDAQEPETQEPIPAPLMPAISARLRLGQDAYVIQTGQPLTLMGQVETADGQPSDRPFPLEALQVRLYDPRTSRILIEERQPLTARTLPFPFTCRITLPEHFQTYLVLGEITLFGTTPEGTTVALVTQPFSVTTDLHELLEAIANDFSEADLPLPHSAADGVDYASSPALEPLDAPVAPVQFRPAPQQPLPPQLRPADPGKTWQSLDLPSFYEATTNEQELEDAEPIELAADQPGVAVDQPIDSPADLLDDQPIDSLTDVAVDLPNGTDTATPLPPQQTAPPPSEPLLVPPPSAAQAFDNDAPIPDWDRDEPRPHPRLQNRSAATKPESPEDVAFRSLNLQERFWTRLQALVADQELTEWLSTFDDAPLDNMPKRRSDEWDTVLTDREVVVEEQLPADSPTGALSELADPQAGVRVLSIQQPIPLPQLEATTGELTAGESLAVQVRLPDLSYPLFVKLWLVDRQNRAVLDGPYWLTDFSPSGFGDLISRYELTVPYGCLELQLEAVAIEMTTQRESDKAVVTRSVVPPHLSDLALDELDV